MKNLVEFLSGKKLIFKKLIKVENKVLQTRKKLQTYVGVTLSSDYVAIFIIDVKSRFLMKNAFEIAELYERLKDKKGHNFKKRVLIHKKEICSKAKKYMTDQGWKLYASL